ncbi:unnamed protein product [Discosporangium mesarthrocarpum]
MDDVESRIIRGGKAKAEMMNMDWEVTHGPFEEEACVFSQLGESHWTLLVNEVNRHLPEVSDLLGFFPFVPSWRVDDIMVSYAPDGGSVGPHVDNYDVFLLQGAGKRRWCIENRFTNAHEESKRSVKDIDVRVIADFTEDQSWVLEPGDALYLPPRIAHHGIPENLPMACVLCSQDCMTYSVGFRAPSTKDMLTFFGEHAASTLTDVDAFYCDPDLKRQDNPGLISRSSVERSKEMLREAFVKALSDDKAFETWFGAHITRSLRDHSGYPVAMDPHELSVGYQTPDDVLRAIKAARGDRTGPFIYRSEGLTFAYIEHGRENNRADFADEGVTLFIDGNNFPLEASLAPLARLLCSSSRFTPQDIQPALDGPPAKGVEALLKGLILEGYLYPADD